METFQSKGYKWFVENYPMIYDNMFKNYYKKLRQKYKWFIIYDMPFQNPIWINSKIEEMFNYVENTGSTSITIQNNQCVNPFKEPIEYIYYDTGDWQSRQKIYGTWDKNIRVDYKTNQMYFCTFRNNKGSFSCGKNFFDNDFDFLLFLNHYQYEIVDGKCKKYKYAYSNKRIELDTDDYKKIHKFVKVMKNKEYNGVFDKVADRLEEIL